MCYVLPYFHRRSVDFSFVHTYIYVFIDSTHIIVINNWDLRWHDPVKRTTACSTDKVMVKIWSDFVHDGRAIDGL